MSVRAQLDNVSVHLGGVQILRSVSLDIPQGTFLTLLGPSGSGKTTTLNVIAGFVRQSAGHVLFDGEPIDALSPRQRGLGIVFQDYALFPHMTVGDNVGFALRARGVGRAERRRASEEALELVRLPGMADRPLTSLSGGQRQRVALARALVFKPRLLLLDEPLAALDKQLRESMQGELKRIQAETGVTTVAVTHDQIEALSMSDQVAVMRDGRLEQMGSPTELYQRPRTEFVAGFLGEANLFPISATGELDPFGIQLPAGGGVALLRPEQLGLAAAPPPDAAAVRVRVANAQFQGARLRLTAEIVGGKPRDPLLLSLPPDTAAELIRPGSEAWVTCRLSDIHRISAGGHETDPPRTDASRHR